MVRETDTITTDFVVNTCYGGYNLSAAAQEAVAKRKGWKIVDETDHGGGYIAIQVSIPSRTGLPSFKDVADAVTRNDPDLIVVVRELGAEANGPCADLRIVTVHVNVNLVNHDGRERVEVHGYAD